MAISFFVFFFQAEDGIRDLIVTGVKTCALPIFARLLEAGAAHWPPEEAAVPRNPGENRANLHPTYYEDLMEFWGTDTPLARRFIFGEWVAFALERPFRREWLQYWPDNEREVPDATEAIGKSWFDVRIGVDQAAS